MGEAEGRAGSVHTTSPRPTMLVGGHQLCVQAEVGSLQTLSAIREPLRRAQGKRSENKLSVGAADPARDSGDFKYCRPGGLMLRQVLLVPSWVPVLQPSEPSSSSGPLISSCPVPTPPRWLPFTLWYFPLLAYIEDLLFTDTQRAGIPLKRPQPGCGAGPGHAIRATEPRLFMNWLGSLEQAGKPLWATVSSAGKWG